MKQPLHGLSRFEVIYCICLGIYLVHLGSLASDYIWPDPPNHRIVVSIVKLDA